jgi:hypothetical protein
MGETIHVVEHGAAADPYCAARRRLTQFLIRATLIESYHSFARHGKPYPFVTPDALRPGAMAPSTEHPFQRGALILLVDGPLPRALRKHIRFRRTNELTPENLAQLAPDIDPKQFDPVDRQADSDSLEELLDRLLGVDYGLLFQQEPGNQSAVPQLSHLHVKVERLTDNAVRELALSLGYVKRRLYEHGEPFVERLEGKYHEYFGFSPNASGRKSAAAMAAQLLARGGQRFTVFSTSQEDCRLTLLDDTDEISHYILVPLAPSAMTAATGPAEASYAVDTLRAGQESLRKVAVLRVRQRRRSPALPVDPNEAPRSADGLDQDWLELVDETLIALPGRDGPAIAINWTIGTKAGASSG